MEKKANCRICRRAGEKLFLKGEKCNLPSCPVSRRSYAPGHLGAKARQKRGSDYSIQLMEKQKARAIYGVSEKQMQNYFNEARKTRSATGQELMKMLESRVDNVVFRLGWALTRDHARQLVTHGHILVNGKKIKSPSLRVDTKYKLGIDKISHENKSEVPNWLKSNDLNAEVIGEPVLDEAIALNINEQLIIEYYSR